MQLIEDTWASLFPHEELITGDLVSHDVVQLRQKEKWGTAAPAPPERDTVGSDDDDDEQDYDTPSEEPSWAKKLKQKMKKLFCL